MKGSADAIIALSGSNQMGAHPLIPPRTSHMVHGMGEKQTFSCNCMY
jgi:hypothetical protein